MPGDANNGMQCAEFDALLSDALDGTLSGAKLEGFQAHGRTCVVCGPLLADAKAGQGWLKSLEDVEPPVNLVHNILAATTGRDVSVPAKGETASWKDALTRWLQPVFASTFAVVRQPRFAMSFGMVFFSLSVTMSLAGVKVSDVRRLDLRPSAVKRAYYETSAKVVKYYENIRFVYEVESRVREFKRITAPAQPAPEQNDKNRKDNNTGQQPDEKQERNYSREESQPVLASLPQRSPVVTVPTYRRLV